MQDSFNRQINYLRISVTDRCNLRCFYCRGVQDFEFIPHKEILSYEEILRVGRIALEMGIDRFKITGGEPLVRKDLGSLIARIRSLSGVSDISLTTNGILLDDRLEELWASGLRRLNISLDSLDRAKYQRITGVDGLERVLTGLKRAIELGFEPVKINVVLLKDLNEDEVEDFIKLAFEIPVHIRFIELMDLSPAEGYFVSATEIKKKYGEKYRLEPLEITGSGPVRNHYRVNDMAGSFGFIAPYSHNFCGSCNRIRLSADGKLRTCLFCEKVYDLKKLLREGAHDSKIVDFIRVALIEKPARWQESRKGINKNGLRHIGG
jgi:cyclic pyranopterin phosphate synthase